jgi:UDP-2-acetamido-2,6-beta-L-arabino-hexul-4-ose reductase
MKIGITGSDGLLGWHQRAYFKAQNTKHEVRLANRATFQQPESLTAFANGLDAIIHYAGMNRGGDAEIESVNALLAKDLVAACERAGASPFVVYANSTHQDRDTAYGRGKRAAAKIFSDWGKKNFANAVLPHVFGEFGKPLYNSVVSTFCHQLARGETPTIVTDGDLELVHAQEVAKFCFETIEARRGGDIRLTGTGMKVSTLLKRLTAMHQAYAAMVLPNLDSPLDARLFNTLRSYLFPGHYPVPLALKSDARGSLFEGLKTLGGGQAFLSTTHPGITRGNHFHTRKFERFLVVRGQAEIRLRKLFTNDIIRFTVSGDAPACIDIPSFHTHDITNTGQSELLTLFWANEIFNPEDPDTIPEPVGTL